MNNDSNDLTTETFEVGAGSGLGRFYYKRDGEKIYLSDFEIWMNEDLLPALGEDCRNGIYREA